MTKREIAAVLEEIAFLLELKGENPFKVKAYSTGARVIESLPEEPAVLVQKGLLRNVKGIGQTLEVTVTELVTTGRSTLHQELLAAFPASLLEMAAIPGLGPKKIKAIYDQLGISSVGELEYACIENRLVGLQGFGQKTQEKILAGIRQYKRRQGFHLYANIIEEAESILAAVRGAPGVVRADHAGEIRRRCEGHGEIELAESGRLPVLLEPGQIQGVFHTHTIYSDGSATLEQMVGATRSLGYRYIGISDHSQSAFYANGLKEDRIRAQHAEIATVQKKIPDVRIFKGIEADILADGAMDYPDEVLATFDFVIASVHSRFNLSEEEQTRRICRALANPYVTMLGHSTGRLLLSRDGYRVDMKQVLDAAASHGKIVEINANPHRLHLVLRLCRSGREKGVKFSINPDAHSTEGLADVTFGVNVARKGCVTAQDVVNTLPVEAMAAKLQAMRP